jgi:UDP-N-acetylglucosamine:LPS N-acetylglucosamine transferase
MLMSTDIWETRLGGIGLKKVLFVSGSIGLGHVTRDMAIAGELRKLRPDIELHWMAGEQATMMLRNAGENVLPESDGFSDEVGIADSMVTGYRLNLAQYSAKANKDWQVSKVKFLEFIKQKNYDLVVGDEAWGVMFAYLEDPSAKKQPLIMVYDFEKAVTVTKSPMDRMINWMINRNWNNGLKMAKKGQALKDFDAIFIGEPEDIPDEKLGLFLGSAREVAKDWKFVGYALRFDPKDYSDVRAQKRKLGYGDEKLVICSKGGTGIGKDLLDLCCRSYPLIKAKIPDVKMVIVAGPSIKPEEIKVPDGVEVLGFIPNLYEYFAACDLAIVQAGGTTTVELTALRRPFIYFPLEEHWEQLGVVVPRLRRHHAGIEMRYYQTTPEQLADAVLRNIGKKVDYADISVDGARKAAEIITRYLPAK